MDFFLILIILVLTVILLVVNFYLLILYCHPDDGGWGSALFCKILVVMGLTLSWAQVLVLPLDVANSQGTADAGLDVQTLWLIIYMSIMIMVTILIPFAMFMYEDDDEKGKTNRCFTAVCYSLVTFCVIAAILFITYIFFRKADIPITILKRKAVYFEDSTEIAGAVTNQERIDDQTVEYTVSFPIYCMAILAFVGWFLFAVFGGVGLSALPIDLIRDFFYRPRLRSSAEAKQIKDQLKQETKRLIEVGKQVQDEEKDVGVESGFMNKRKAKSKLNKSMREFRVGVFNLDKNYQIFKLELNYLDHNPLLFIGKFILGCLFCVVSVIWWIHILISIVIKSNGDPLHPFLNNFLIGLNDGAGFMATGVFAFLSLYLLWCTTKGTLKLGLRLLCFTIHPMKVNETWMNSFLFNIQLILLASVSVTQFCAKAFSSYARLTDIDLMFNGQIKYLRFYGFFNDNSVFEIILLVWSVLCAFYLGCTAPKRDGVLAEIDALKKAKFKK